MAAFATLAVAAGVGVAIWATGGDSSGAPATSTSTQVTTAAEPTTAAAPDTTAPPTTAEPEASAPSTAETAPTETVPDTPDVTRPELVDGVERTAATADSVTVGWTPGRDDRGVTAYAVDRDGVELETVTEPEIVIGGLPCGTLTTVGVRALDEAGNEGPARRRASRRRSAPAPPTSTWHRRAGTSASARRPPHAAPSSARTPSRSPARPSSWLPAPTVRRPSRPTRPARRATTSRSVPPPGPGSRSAR